MGLGRLIFLILCVAVFISSCHSSGRVDGKSFDVDSVVLIMTSKILKTEYKYSIVEKEKNEFEVIASEKQIPNKKYVIAEKDKVNDTNYRYPIQIVDFNNIINLANSIMPFRDIEFIPTLDADNFEICIYKKTKVKRFFNSEAFEIDYGHDVRRIFTFVESIKKTTSSKSSK